MSDPGIIDSARFPVPHIWARVTIPVTISIGPYSRTIPEDGIVRHAQEIATRKVEKALGSGCVTAAPHVELDRHGK